MADDREIEEKFWEALKDSPFIMLGIEGARDGATQPMTAVFEDADRDAGLVQLWKAGSCSFLDHLDEAAQRPAAKWLGRIGYAARGIIFLTVGWLLAKAAIDHNAVGAGGLEQALDALRGPLEIPVAAGLALFGLYSLVEARYRTIHKPPTKHVKRKVVEKLAA